MANRHRVTDRAVCEFGQCGRDSVVLTLADRSGATTYVMDARDGRVIWTRVLARSNSAT